MVTVEQTEKTETGLDVVVKAEPFAQRQPVGCPICCKLLYVIGG